VNSIQVDLQACIFACRSGVHEQTSAYIASARDSASRMIPPGTRQMFDGSR
jgi:hypothetical protein